MRRPYAVAVITLLTVAAAAGVGWQMQRPSWTGPSADRPRPAVEPVGPIVQVAHNLFLVPGGGGNTAVFVTKGGVVLVDTKYQESWRALERQVRTVTDKPITHVINTHFHGDHTGGNEYLPAGVEVVMHANTNAHMVALGMPQTGDGTRNSVRTYTNPLTLFSGEDTVDLYSVGPSHTDGDTFVVFRHARVMHTGDVFPGKVAPIINLEWGGDGVGFARALAKAVAEIRNVDRIIPGHAPITSWKEFVEYGEFMQLLVAYVQSEMHFGTDKNRVFRRFVLPDHFVGYNMERSFETFDEIDRSIRPRWQRVLPWSWR